VRCDAADVSETNVDLHRRSVDAFNTRDVENFIALCSPEIELHSAVTVPGGATYRGHDGVRRWYRDLADGWGDDLRIEPEAYFDFGPETVTFHALHGRGQHSGADVAMPAAHVCRWQDGLMVYFRGYSDRDEALQELMATGKRLKRVVP
jgi:ketosteroid isomerase-like protein